MLDRDVFVRPIAHRGWHDKAKGLIENTVPAFEAAIAKGYGIECDLRPAAEGLPVVFHDATLERLVEGSGPVANVTRADLRRLAYRGTADTRLLSFAGFLALVAGRVPLLVEIKSEWDEPQRAFLEQVARLASSYRGPIALMSFDPAVMTVIRELAPAVPRGIVSGLYKRDKSDDWWTGVLTPERQERLSHLLDSRQAAPDFFAYHVRSLPTLVTRYVREAQGLPLFTWTVRTPADRAAATEFADAPIFEGYEP